MQTDNNRNFNEKAAGAQGTPAERNSGSLRDAARQLEASISRFVQENQRTYENLNRQMDHPSDQIWGFKQEIAEIRRATERNLELIRSYRQ